MRQHGIVERERERDTEIVRRYKRDIERYRDSETL